MASISAPGNVSFWKKLVDEPNSCISLVKKDLRCALPCCYLEDIKTGINAFIQTKITRFVPELGGILAGHGKLNIVSPKAKILFNQPNVYITISGDFYVFAPSVGSTLTGIVSKKSPMFLGCLVHGLFNASVPQPHNQLKEEWIGTKANLHDEATFVVTKVDFQSPVPYIRGDLTEIKQVATENAEQETINSESYDSGIEEASAKKKKEKQKKMSPEKVTETPSSSKNAAVASSSTKKGKKRDRSQVDESEANVKEEKIDQGPAEKRSRLTVDELVSSLIEDVSTSIQNHFETPVALSESKKKRKKSVSRLADVSIDDLANSLLEEVSKTTCELSETPKNEKQKQKKRKSVQKMSDVPVDDLASSLLEEVTGSSKKEKLKKTPKASRESGDLDAMASLLVEKAEKEMSAKSSSRIKKESKKRDVKRESAIDDEAMKIFNSVFNEQNVKSSPALKTPKKKTKSS